MLELILYNSTLDISSFKKLFEPLLSLAYEYKMSEATSTLRLSRLLQVIYSKDSKCIESSLNASKHNFKSFSVSISALFKINSPNCNFYSKSPSVETTKAKNES